jgi:eukaryotic-like serine/threonine-protein kinase
VYALGIILYEMLTGHVPFSGPNPLVAMNQRLMNDPEPPSHFGTAITPHLQEILWRALERDPRLRYPSARHFGLDLRDPQQVALAQQAVPRDWHSSRKPQPRGLLPYILLGMIPVVIFALLLIVAHQK